MAESAAGHERSAHPARPFSRSIPRGPLRSLRPGGENPSLVRPHDLSRRAEYDHRVNTITQSLEAGVPLLLFPGLIFERRFNTAAVRRITEWHAGSG